MKYFDIETGETLTREQLEEERREKIESGEIDDCTTEQYINNCLTRNNGTLDIIYEKGDFVK